MDDEEKADLLGPLGIWWKMDCRSRQHLRTDFFRHDRSHYSIPSAFVELEHLSIVTITVKFLRHHGAGIWS